MPDRMDGHIHHLKIFDAKEGEFKGFILLAHDKNHRLRHVEIHAAKAGSTIHGVLSSYEQAINVALRDQESLADLVSEMQDAHFSPHGATNDPDIPVARSIPDYIARRIRLDGYLPEAAVHSAPAL